MTGSGLVLGLAGGLVAAGLWTAAMAALGVPVFGQQRARQQRTPPRILTDRRLQVRASASAATGLAVLLLIGWPVAAIVTACALYFLPGMLSNRSAKARVARLQGIEEWVRQLADNLSGNATLEQALQNSAERPPAALIAEVTGLVRRLNLGTPLPEALQTFAAEVDSELGDMAVGALSFAAGTRGPGLRKVLTDLARTISLTVETERQIDAERASHRVTARAITVAICLFAVFAMVNQSYVEPFGSVAGQAALGFVGVMWAVAIYWIHKLGSGPAGFRFLADRKGTAR